MGGNMRLRNKKTGEVIDSACIGVFKHQSSGDCKRVDTEARSLSKFLEQWEDYKPAEPLIKDERVRKAVRAWAEAESEDCYYGQDAKTIYNGSGDYIEFWSRPFKDLTPYEHYTIAELCGEEEE